MDKIQKLKELTLTLSQKLSSIPTHPYDKQKHFYLKNPSLSSIESVSVPESFNLDSFRYELAEHGHRLKDEAISRFETMTLSADNINVEGASNMMSVLSGDKFVIDLKASNNFYEFLELCRNLTPGLIQSNPQEIAQKLLVAYKSCVIDKD